MEMTRSASEHPEKKQRMTIDELYGKVLADDKLKASLTEAAKAGKIEE